MAVTQKFSFSLSLIAIPNEQLKLEIWNFVWRYTRKIPTNFSQYSDWEFWCFHGRDAWSWGLPGCDFM